MLSGIRVLDLTGASGWLAGKILADLGADVLVVEPPGGHPDRGMRFAFAALNAGKRSAILEPEAPELRRLAVEADVVIETGDAPIRYEDVRTEAPHLVWCAITPFGRDGPKAGWRGSDLSVVAQSGNMYLTGDPDRAPLRCTYPTSWYHGGAEAAAGILAALWRRESTGRGQLVDVSLQETVILANMGRAGEFSLTKKTGGRVGAMMRVGKTLQREIWRAKDGHVSLGLRGGPARIPGLKRLVAWMDEEGMATPALLERDWDSYNHNVLTQEEVDEISEAFQRFFLTKTMTELYEAALTRGLMLAPANTAREMLASRQSAAREVFTEIDDPDLGPIPLPRLFMKADAAPGVRGPAPRPGAHEPVWRDEPQRPSPRTSTKGAAFEDLKILEFGSGAAGPMSMRFFADHGATVVRVESSVRPDFLRLYAITATQKSLDASPMFAQFNCNKLAITLNMKHPEARAVALRFVEWADVVAENFAPGAMSRWGLAAEDLFKIKPDLVMVSTCLHGQTGPEKDYPGFGGQGSAISGFNHLTGWPDREPVGPHGTITDSLSPRFAALAVMAGLLHRTRTGRGTYLDVSQVECALYCLAETVVEYAVTGAAPGRAGNRSARAAPHGAFRCRGEDRWVALAVWTDEEWRKLVEAMGSPAWAEGRFAAAEGRLANVGELEKRLEQWTAAQDRDALAESLRAAGLEAAAVADLADLHADPQLAHRGHFRPMAHPVIGRHDYEALGFRLSDSPPRFTRPGPTLGRDNEEVYKELLGMSDEEYARLAAAGVFD